MPIKEYSFEDKLSNRSIYGHDWLAIIHLLTFLKKSVPATNLNQKEYKQSRNIDK